MHRHLILACLAAWLLSGCASRGFSPFADEAEAWSYEPYPSLLSR